MISRFINITSRKDEGVIHIQNASIIYNETLFKNCSSLEGGGGDTLYLINKYNNTNIVTLIQDQVQLCESQYGGEFYIYSNNRAIVYAEKVGGIKYDVSGVYVTLRRGSIKQNTFIDNIGTGSTLKNFTNQILSIIHFVIPIIEISEFFFCSCF